MYISDSWVGMYVCFACSNLDMTHGTVHNSQSPSYLEASKAVSTVPPLQLGDQHSNSYTAANYTCISVTIMQYNCEVDKHTSPIL